MAKIPIQRFLRPAILVVVIILMAWAINVSSGSVNVIIPGASGNDPYLGQIIQDVQKELVKTRPEFPGMLNLEDIKAGMIVYEAGTYLDSEKDYKIESLILKGPYTDNDGVCRFDTAYWTGGVLSSEFMEVQYCADSGLVEYNENGFHGWNPSNHLLRSGQPDLTEAELEAVKSRLKPEPGFNTTPVLPESHSL
jgi:hypothetical protein